VDLAPDSQGGLHVVKERVDALPVAVADAVRDGAGHESHVRGRSVDAPELRVATIGYEEGVAHAVDPTGRTKAGRPSAPVGRAGIPEAVGSGEQRRRPRLDVDAKDR